MNNLTIQRTPLSFLKEYHEVPIRFSADTIYPEELFVGKGEGINLTEIQVPPFTKDYDEHESPYKWVEKWDAILKNILSVNMKTSQMRS